MKKIMVIDDFALMSRGGSEATAKKKKIVVIASSTGGPAVLRNIVPAISKDISIPVIIVQHMPKGFTKSFADRLDSDSEISVHEAEDGQLVERGNVYLARGGMHIKLRSKGEWGVLEYTDEPPREGVKPCANYLYESLIDSDYDEIICVVLTGMGQDGCEGIYNLSQKKNCRVIIQSEATCTIYGMPKAVHNKGLEDEVLDADKIAARINELAI